MKNAKPPEVDPRPAQPVAHNDQNEAKDNEQNERGVNHEDKIGESLMH